MGMRRTKSLPIQHTIPRAIQWFLHDSNHACYTHHLPTQVAGEKGLFERV